jgi:hypothetical protein
VAVQEDVKTKAPDVLGDEPDRPRRTQGVAMACSAMWKLVTPDLHGAEAPLHSKPAYHIGADRRPGVWAQNQYVSTVQASLFHGFAPAILMWRRCDPPPSGIVNCVIPTCCSDVQTHSP